MLKHSTATIALTIVFLVLMTNLEHLGTYAAKEVLNLNTIYDKSLHHVAKRMNLETCLVQFDVHKNTIIRTGESQAIGGKYLQGLELDTIEECQRLCCETESCDVYIFESKKDGYCYLFECGTPENFHCKFTRHANYTSAVLTPVIRHFSDLTTPHPPLMSHKGSTGISQQEWELSNLKIKPEVREKTVEIGLPALDMNSMSGSTSSKKSLSDIQSSDMSQTQKVNSSVQCGRFQFACHSGECIAVYNACDGIPQCEDGSDEGPECSGANNNLSSNSKSTSDVIGVNNVIPPAAASGSLPQYQSSLMQQSAQQQLQSMQQQHQAQSSAVLSSVSAVNNREDPNVWETRKIVSGTPVVGGNLDSQNVNQLPSASSADGFTSYVNNRTPSHGSPDGNTVGTNSGSTLEQSGLYMPHLQDSNGAYVQQHQQHILLPPPPPPPPAPVNSNWQQQAILNQQQQKQQSLSMTQQQLPLPQGSNYALQNDVSAQQQQPQQMMQQQPQQPAQILVPSLPQLQSAIDPQLTTGVLNPSLAQTDVKSDDSEEYEDSEEKSTEPPKRHKHKKSKSKSKDLSKTENGQAQAEQSSQGTATKTVSSPAKTIKTAASPVHEQYEIIHQNMALEFRDHDGQSERPGGAVLSLTLGLLITAALAILIGCRMRTVGRRARRLGGKTPYSHEADFLVNGMYL